MNYPYFNFKSPGIKWIEIDDSIIPPLTRVDDEQQLILIDTEWGEPNIPRKITTLKEFIDYFGEVPSPIESIKGMDYLPQYLQQMLQGSIPMYVVRVGYTETDPDTGQPRPLSYYKQSTIYRFLNTDPVEELKIEQKYQGLYGQDLFITFMYDNIFDVYSCQIGKLIEYVPQTGDPHQRKESKFQIFEQFTQSTLQELIQTVKKSSKYITVDYISGQSVNQEEHTVPTTVSIQLNNQNVNDILSITNNSQTKTYVNGTHFTYNQDGIVTFDLTVQDHVELGENIIVQYVYLSDGNPITTTETHNIPLEVKFTLNNTQNIDINSVVVKNQSGNQYINNIDYTVDYTTGEISIPKNSSIQFGQIVYVDYTLGLSDSKLDEIIRVQKYRLEVQMQTGTKDEPVHRVKGQSLFEYIDGQEIIDQNNITFNPQKSLYVDFQQQIEDLIINHEVDNPEKFKISTIPTLGISKHSYFLDQETDPDKITYPQFINKWVTDVILGSQQEGTGRRDQVVIGDVLDIVKGDGTKDQIDVQIDSVKGVYEDIKGSYVQLYYPWLKGVIDNVETTIPPSFYVISKFYQFEPWETIQGYRRGVIGFIEPQKKIKDEDKDRLQKEYINSIMWYQNVGSVIMEERTKYSRLSVLQRLSQRRIQMRIEKEVTSSMRKFLFEPLIQSTFDQINQDIQQIMDKYVKKEQVYEYKTEIDTSPHLLDNNMIIVTLKFKPMKFLEFIELNFIVRSYSQGV